MLSLFTYSWESLVPVLLASVDGITSELLDAGVKFGNVDVEDDTADGDTVDRCVVDEGNNWFVDAGEETSAGVDGVEAEPGVDVVDVVDDVGIVVVEVGAGVGIGVGLGVGTGVGAGVGAGVAAGTNVTSAYTPVEIIDLSDVNDSVSCVLVPRMAVGVELPFPASNNDEGDTIFPFHTLK